LQTIGFSLPVAVGVKAAAPHEIVVDIYGDAGFSMIAVVFQTASQSGIGVKVLVLNNRFQGMVLLWQGTSSTISSPICLRFLAPPRLFRPHHDARYFHMALTNPNFILLAQAMC